MNSVESSSACLEARDPSGLPAAAVVGDAGRGLGMGWLKLILAGNPLYPVSAGLLLLGVYQLSVDPGFLGGETPKLLFNFGALQLYELLLIGVAVLLARRRIVYDATMLVVIENLLVLVPFILLTQAVLIGRALAIELSIAGGLLVALRFGGLRRFFPDLHLPSRVLVGGAVILAANVALPFVYRPIMELDVADWEGPSQVVWLCVLPALQALAFAWLPGDHRTGRGQEGRWLPVLLFHLWIGGSAVHLYCVGYVSNLPLQAYLLAPLLWVTAWSLWRHGPDCVPAAWRESTRRALLVVAALAPLAAFGAEHRIIFPALMLANSVILGRLYLRTRERWSGELALAGAFILFAGLPGELLAGWFDVFGRSRAILIGLASYGVIRSFVSGRLETALLGAGSAAVWAALVFGGESSVSWWSLQCGLLYLLAHDLRRMEPGTPAAAVLRWPAALGLMIHSVIWLQSAAAPAAWVFSLQGLVLVAGFGAVYWGIRRPAHWVIPGTGVVLCVASPAKSLLLLVQMAPAGLLVLAASFLTLAAGTILAVTKSRWQR